jgi:hypothetical protein
MLPQVSDLAGTMPQRLMAFNSRNSDGRIVAKSVVERFASGLCHSEGPAAPPVPNNQRDPGAGGISEWTTYASAFEPPRFIKVAAEPQSQQFRCIVGATETETARAHRASLDSIAFKPRVLLNVRTSIPPPSCSAADRIRC